METSQLKNLMLRNKHVLLFGSIILAGAILRFYRIDSQSLWFDELHSIVPTAPESNIGDVIEYAKSDQPPLFFVLLSLWFKVFPYNEASGRIFCAIIGTFGVLSIYYLGKEVAGKTVGLVASAVTAFNMFHVYYSQELRFYSLLFLITTVCFLFFIRFIKDPSLRNQTSFTITATLLLYTHYFGIVVVVAQALIFVFITLLYKKGLRFFIKGLMCAIITIVAFSPWLSIIFKDSTITSFWIEDPSPWFFVEYFQRYFNGWWAVAYKPIFTSLLFGLVICYIVFTWSQRAYSKELIIKGWVIGGGIILTLLIPYVYSKLKIPLLLDRYTMITLPLIIIVISTGFSAIKNSYVQAVIVLLFAFFSFRAYNRYFKKFRKQEMRELTQQVVTNNSHNYPMLSRWAWHLNFYAKKFGAEKPIVALQGADLANSLHAENGVWIFFPQHMDEQQLRQLDAMGFHQTTELKFYEAYASLYEKAR